MQNKKLKKYSFISESIHCRAKHSENFMPVEKFAQQDTTPEKEIFWAVGEFNGKAMLWKLYDPVVDC